MRKITRDKKGISIMIGYILLVVFAIIISATVFQWLRTFVPAQSLECPQGTSLLIDGADFNSGADELTLTLKNNGRFNVAGYFVHVTNNEDDELPAIDISGNLDTEISEGSIVGSSVLFLGTEDNPFSPGDETTHTFDIDESVGENIYLISVIPARFQEVRDVNRFVSCGNMRRQSQITTT